MNNSRKKLLALFFLIVALRVPQSLCAHQASSGSATPGAARTAKKENVGKKTPKAATEHKGPELAITKIDPDAPIASDSSQEQTLTVIGAADGEKLKVIFKSPDSKSQPEQEATVSKDVIKTSTKLSTPGTWVATVSSQTSSSSPRSFIVRESSSKTACRAEEGAPQVKAYWKIFTVMNRIVAALFIVLIVGLVVASFSKRRWSLGDALSEESSMQPKEIESRDQVVMVASSSRIIAVFGLAGVLALVIGVGYAIVWSLVVCGTTPDLGPIKAFLVGMAAVFAPYLANQLRETFSPSNPPKDEAAKPAALSTIKISGILPALPLASPTAQPLTLLGSEFQAWMGVTLINPDGQTVPVAAASVQVGGPTQCQVTAVVDRGGSWKAVVTSPSGPSSPAFVFKVTAPAPAITGVAPPNVTPGADPQQLTVNGHNLMPNVVATLISPGGGEKKLPASWANANQIQLQAVIQPAGAWRVKLQNPGNDLEAEHAFNVA